MKSVPLEKRPQRDPSLLLPCAVKEDGALCEPACGLHQTPNLRCLELGLAGSRTVRSKVLLCRSHPMHGIFFIAAQTDEDSIVVTFQTPPGCSWSLVLLTDTVMKYRSSR